MVRWTSAFSLLLGTWVTCSLLLPQVTVAHSLKQKSADEDLVFEDDDFGLVGHLTHTGDKLADLPIAVIGGNDEGLPEGAAKTRVKRQFSSFFPTDDEDTVDGSGVGSGDGSGRYRIELEVDGYYQQAYANPSSAEFSSMSARVQYPIDTQLNKLLGTTDARLTRIQPSGTDRLKLLVDVGVVDSDIDEFQIRAIFDDFDTTGQMGDFTNVKLLRFNQEQDPHAGKCGFGEVLCPSGTCAALCNGVRECPLGEDERDCLDTPVEVDVTELTTTPASVPVLTTTSKPECDIDEFKCADDGTCIQDFFKCDSQIHCSDGSDEAPSVCGGCRPDQLTCTADDRCLPVWAKCDGRNDCSDGSDESLRECCVGGFWCDNVCRDISVSCNQVPDCQDGSDEVGCPVTHSQARCEEKGYLGGYPSSATEDDSACATIDTQLPSFQVSSLVQSYHPPSSSRNECTLTEVMGMLHKVASNVNDLQTGLKRISSQQDEFADLLSKKFKKLEHRSAVFEQKLDEVRKPQPSSNEPLPGPAKTVEELDILVKQHELPVALKGLVRVSVSESVRRILKRLFTRELAMQFSFSGLGHRRQQSKIAFKDHSAMRIIYEVLAAGGFTNHKDIAVATQRGLRGSVHWDGSRHHRGTGATETAGITTTTSISTITTTESTDTVPSPSITDAAELVPSSNLVESDSE